MIKEWADKWAAALRSGKYRQTTHELGRVIGGQERNCCLGVLCRITGSPRWEAGNSGIVYYGNMHGSPPPDVFDETQISEGSVSRLIAFNDLDRRSFSEIADYIEKNWEEL